MKTIGFAMCGSFCTHEKVLAELEQVASTLACSGRTRKVTVEGSSFSSPFASPVLAS